MTHVSQSESLYNAQQLLESNRDFADGAGDVSKAYAYRQAIMTLLEIRPSEASLGGPSGERIRFDPPTLLALLKRVDNWLKLRSYGTRGGGVTYTRYCGR